MRRRNACGSASRDAHAVERDGPGARIVEAQEQMEDRALAGARGADDRDLLARRARENDTPSSTRRVGPRRIGEAHVVERDLAARRRRQRDRMRRRLDRRLDREEFGQALGRAGGLRDLAPHLAQLAQARRRRTPRRARTGRACPASCGRPARPARRPTARPRRWRTRGR